jgi:beta-mannanase
MLNFDLYAIYTDKSERSGSIDELFVSFEEAMNNRMKYANWYCNKGDIWIQKISREKFSVVEKWHINDDGTIGTHYIRGKAIR